MKQTALITGSTSGIGKATATALAKRGWHVIIHGRDMQKCLQAAEEIKQATQCQKIDFLVADLSDLAAVKQMALVIPQRFPQLNVLVNNAGTFHHSRILTSDGLEQTWVVNYLSRFLLTYLLLDTLKQNQPSRIIDISGMYHSKGEIHFEDVSLAHQYSMGKANNQTKLANVLFTYKLARELEGSGVTSNTLHPGAVNTGSVLRSEGFSPFFKWMYRLMSIFFKTPEQGAATSVFLASSPEVEDVSGRYFINQKPATSSPATQKIELQDQLWEFSLQSLKDKGYLN